MRLPAYLLAILLVALLAACSPGFESPSEVNDLRILAVQVEPPEALYASDALGIPTDLAAFEPPMTRVRLLVANPVAASEKLSYEVGACILGEGQECEPDKPNPAFGSGKSLPGVIEVEATLPLDLVMASAEADMAKGFFGSAVWMKGEVSDGETDVPFLKAFLVLPDYGGLRTPNRNPRITELRQGKKKESEPLELADDGALEVEAGGDAVRILPVIPEEDREAYMVLTFELEEKELTEEMTVRFYADCGSWNGDETTEVLDIAFETEEDRKNKDLSLEWTPPDEPAECTLWFVAMDARGGIGWTTLPVRVL
jgi:hypothetical protein